MTPMQMGKMLDAQLMDAMGENDKLRAQPAYRADKVEALVDAVCEVRDDGIMLATPDQSRAVDTALAAFTDGESASPS